jgi:transposase
LKAKTKAWLKVNAKSQNLVNITRAAEILRAAGHEAPLLTPPYHPELQPIEKLWRDVKMYVARQYSTGRTFTQLIDQVLEGFRRYGTVQHCAN